MAEELILLGKPEDAKGLADAGLSQDTPALRDYLAAAPAPSRDLALADEDARAHLAGGRAAEALALLSERPQPAPTVTEIRALQTRALALDALGRKDEAATSLDRLAIRASAIQWKRAEIAAQHALLARAGPDDESPRVRRILGRLLVIDQEASDVLRSAAWCARLGSIEAKQGGFRTACAWLLEADGLYEARARSPGLTLEQQREHARTLARLAEAQLKLGDTARAFAVALHGYDLSKALQDGVRVETAKTLARAYQFLARPKEEERLLEEAADLAERVLPARHPHLLGDLARAKLALGDLDGARALYDRLLTSDAVRNDPRARFVLRLHIAAAWIDRPADVRATQDLQRAVVDLGDVLRDLELAADERIDRREIEANAKALLGRAFNLLNRPTDAEPHLRDVVQSRYGRDVPRLLTYAQTELAHALRVKGAVGEALALTREVLASLEQETARLSPSLVLSLLAHEDSKRLVEEHLASALASGSPMDVVRALEDSRGVAFRAEARRRRLTDPPPGGGAGSSEMASLAEGVAQAARQYGEAKATGLREPSANAARALWESRLRLRRAQEQDDAAMPSATAPEPGAATPFRQAPALRPDEAMLYVASTAEEYVAVLEWRGRAIMAPLGAPPRVEGTAEDARRGFLAEGADAPAAPGETVARLLLPAGILDALAPPEATSGLRPQHVYVSASGPLARLPWSVLFEDAFRQSGRAGPPPTVSLVASKAVLRHVRDWTTPTRDGPLLALGDAEEGDPAAARAQRAYFGGSLSRLPHSAEEVSALVDEERGDVALLANQATEAQLRRCLFSAPYPFEVLHLSCHGKLYGPAPWLSALAVCPSAGDDGLLTVDEIGRWRFPHGPHLVVLAACESGLGVPVPAEGEEGLVRSFLLAGARHVVASLWEVPDDATRDLMISFHRHRREEGLSPVLALRSAQADVRAHGGAHALPRSWAGWAVWGPAD